MMRVRAWVLVSGLLLLEACRSTRSNTLVAQCEIGSVGCECRPDDSCDADLACNAGGWCVEMKGSSSDGGGGGAAGDDSGGAGGTKVGSGGGSGTSIAASSSEAGGSTSLTSGAGQAGGGGGSSGGTGGASSTGASVGGASTASDSGGASSGNGGLNNNSNGGSGMEAGGSGGTTGDVETDIVLSYWPSYSSFDRDWPVTSSIEARIILQNYGAAPIPLDELTVHYWYSSESDGQIDSFIDYCKRCVDEASSIQSVERQGTDRLVEVSWAGGTLEADPELDVEVHLRVNHTEVAPSYEFDHSNDWSCNVDGTPNVPMEWDRITVYRNSVLVWGIEPAQ